MRASLLFLLLFRAALYAGQPITDEAERMRVLSAVFPGMGVVPRAPYPIVKSEPDELIVFPDALQSQTVYRIEGAASREETCASEDVATLERSRVRELRLVVYRWSNSSDMLAILQYEFIFGDSGGPARSCSSLGRIIHVAASGGAFRITENRGLESTHHGGIERIELADVTGDDRDELLVESDWGGAGTVGSSLLIFSLHDGRLEQLAEVVTRLESFDKTFTQVFDKDRSRSSGGKSFCFTRADLGAGQQIYQTPRTSTPCYPIGTQLSFN